MGDKKRGVEVMGDREMVDGETGKRGDGETGRKGDEGRETVDRRLKTRDER